MNRSDRNRRCVIVAGWAALALLAPGVWAGALAPVRPTPVPVPRPSPDPMMAVVVTDQDPAAVPRPDGSILLANLSVGPFNAQRTLTLHVLSVFDRSLVGPQRFDQVTVLTLPDGGVYEKRVTPVDPRALPGDGVVRPDLGPAPVPVEPTPRMKKLARMLPPGRVDPGRARDATYTDLTLPVSGTWITSHNLYGEWRVAVSMVRDGKTLSTAETTFRLGLD